MGRSCDTLQLIYENEAGPGSSGSPSFNTDLQLIGMHVSRDDKNVRYGASIDSIVADLANKSFVACSAPSWR